MRRRRIAEASKGVGKPKVGGPFTLTDQDGRTVTHEDLKGKYALVRATLHLQMNERRSAVTSNEAKKLDAGLLWLHALPGHLP